MLVYVGVFVIVALVVLIVIAPLRRGRAERAELLETSEVAELEAEKDARYREIRDAELDYRTGKLSDEDYRELDRGLRAEAVDILRRLDRAGGGLPSWSDVDAPEDDDALDVGAELPAAEAAAEEERLGEHAEARSEKRSA